ncbi:MAG TPA: hypothetical protein VE710_15860 [Candidatus Bathyarchaeia archaeon]|nr:hypothetical protein [Candidatus Bathyarchaeia archaeon]
MDKIRFEERIGEESEKIVKIYINERSFIDLVKEYETSFAGSIAGDYAWLWSDVVFLPSRHFLGEPIYELDFYNGKSAVLGCECGIVECWPLVAKITLTQDTVTWSDFEQPHRGPESAGGHWDYRTFGPFVFDRKEYESQLSKG